MWLRRSSPKDSPVPEPEARFVEVDDPDGRTRWRLDAGFLTSGYECIWGRGCQGIHDERRPELMDGCCSVGVGLRDDEEAMNVVALAASMEADVFEHAGVDVIERTGARWSTRIVDGACVFLNRPGFTGGVGCALHLGALAAGDEPEDWKPQTCSRMPLRVEERTADDGSVEVTVRACTSVDWGPGGASMAWWCVDDPAAFAASTPYVDRHERVLRDLMGDDLFDAARPMLG
jgi:hypothetical protein